MIAMLKWAPAAVLGVGAALVHGVAPQRAMPLEAPLESVVPESYQGWEGVDQTVSDAEARVAGFTDYVLRTYSPEGEAEYGAQQDGSADAAWMSLYVGFYESQTQGKTIHSPKNCLPGAGWEPLQSTVATVPLPGGETARVNRYILQRESAQALVLYWYQGRGRVAHDEYRVKFDLLRDAALMRRSDEALVRIVIPVTSTEEAAFEKAQAFAGHIIPSLETALPQ